MRPDLKQIGDEHLDYTVDACIDHDLAEEGVDPRSPEGIAALRRWTYFRAKTCSEILVRLPVVDGRVRGHRLIACAPEQLRPALGLFWTHNFDDWPDPYAPWSEGGRDAPTIVIEAQIPVEAIDWQTSCMALMDWYSGDCESELRVFPGRSEEHTSELQSLMRISYAVFCLKKQTTKI